MKYIPCFLLLLGFCLQPLSGKAETKELPLWEIGLYGYSGSKPDYPAASKNSNHFLIFPYLVYRGEIIRSDEKGGLRGVFMDTDLIELDISVKGAFPVSSENNPERAGMPDLDWIGEIGPRILFKLMDSDAVKLTLDLPLRAAFSTNITSIKQRGWVFEPSLFLYSREIMNTDIGMRIQAGSTFAGKEFMDYIYGVAPQFATASRPSYRAKGGYLGSSLSLKVSKPIYRGIQGRIYLGIDSFEGAKNSVSPLFRKKVNFSAGIAFVWRFMTSSTKNDISK